MSDSGLKNKSHNNAITDFIRELSYLDYNSVTIKTYSQQIKRFLTHYKEINPALISNEQIRKFIIYIVKEKKYSPDAQNQTISAIKLFYRLVYQREVNEYYLPRPRKEKKLPKILTESEVAKILKNIVNLRDKCIIFLIYSAGLTPSEVSYIKISDIDSKKMQIFITSAKGDKNRYVILSNKLLDLLRLYYRKYKPKKWLFENAKGGQFSKRTMQKVFKNAVIKSGIKKPATLTILKNSFAVHLIEKGVDIRYVQQLMGHKDSKTTMKYLKVSKRDIKLISSSLDSLDI